MEPNKSNNNGNISILIVEDSPTQAEQLEYILVKNDYKVTVACNGYEALDQINKSKPSIILSDIVMPEMDGYELCRRIRANVDLKDTPVILITSLSDPEDVIKGLECGANNLLIKPFDEKYLLARISYIISNIELRSKTAVQMGINLVFEGKKYFIDAERMQILDLLLGIYETAVQKNLDLIRTQDKLRNLNEQLEQKVAERTKHLVTEIKERKQTEKALLKSEIRSNETQRIAHVGSWELDLITKKMFWSDEVYRLFNLEPNQFKATYDAFLEAIHPDDRDLVNKAYTDSLKTRRPYNITHRLLFKDGTIKYVNERCESVYDEFGKPLSSIGMIQDITDRVCANKKLQKSEKKYRSLLDEDISGNFISDPEGKLLFCNPAFLKIFEFDSMEQALAYDTKRFYPDPKTREIFFNILKREKKLIQHEMELITVTGKKIVVIENIVGSFDENNELNEIKGYIYDITEQKQIELQFRQAQKMQSIGMLAGGIAHDFNNLLTVINGYSDVLERQSDITAPTKMMIKHIRQAGERASTLTSQLLAFSRQQIIQPKVININYVVTNIEDIVRRLIGENIELKISLDSKLYNVKMDKGQLDQIIMNLIVNARDAMPGGGILSLETTNVTLDKDSTLHHHDIQPGNYALLAVRDNGIGMDEVTKAKVFDPFFTTKEKGQGTGLGLSTVYGIVKQNNGHIWVCSEPGSGTSFKIYFPTVDEEIQTTEVVQINGNTFHGSECILIVEDDPGVRNLCVDILHDAGFQVLEAENGEQALSICETHKESIHLMITDVIMPKMGGLELENHVSALHPDIKILFISGYTDRAVVDFGVLDGGKAFLQKPFSPGSLIKKIRKVLGTHQPSLSLVRKN